MSLEYESETSLPSRICLALVCLLLGIPLLLWLFSKLSAPLKRSAPASNPQDSTNVHGDVRQDRPIQIEVIHSLEERTAATRKETREDKRYRVEKWTMLFVLAYAAVAILQWCAMNQNLKEAQTQTEIAKQQMEASERPWLSVDASIDGPLIFKPPKTGPGEPNPFIVGQTGAMIRIKFILTNKGHSPAVNVNINPLLIPDGGSTNAKDQVDKLCGKDKSPLIPLGGGFGQVIFQDDKPFEWPLTFFASKKDVDAAAQDRLNQLLPLAPNYKGRLLISFSIVGCVGYQSGFTNAAVIGSKQSTKFATGYQTGFWYEIEEPIDPRGPDVPASDLHLRHELWGFWVR